jgi:pimeloyl-ACP methyl ester carboxylesterase
LPYTEIKGLKVNYEVHGEGEPVVLLHHGFGCLKMWEDVWPRLTAAGFQVVLYDRRGYGSTERGPEWREWYTSDDFRTYVVEELAGLLDYLGLDRVHLVGQCEGGVLGVDFAVEHFDRAASLVAASTLCYSDITLEEFNRLKFTPDFHDLNDKIKNKMIEWHGAEQAADSYNQFARYGGAYGRGRFDLRGKLPLAACPTLVLYPDRSALFDVEQGVSMYRCLLHGELAVLPRCGHNSYDNYPAEYAELVTSFIRRAENADLRPDVMKTCAQ